MSDVAIRVEDLSKRYRIGQRENMNGSFGGAVTNLVTRPIRNFRRLQKLSNFSENGPDPEDIIWALKDVSFDVKEGEIVGIIGRNGAGKSTLLKILTRITEPTQGHVTLKGRVGSLLEVGTGFHPELTGRENVYLNGAVLGMGRREIDRKFDEIVDFSGVERFIDTAVKRYSSGMKVRLAFAVAAHLECEVLLVDEVLAVGDAEFQRKCLGKMGGVSKEGRTVLFVSHNMGAVQALCQRGILIRQGHIALDGPLDEAVGDYLAYLTSGAEHAFDNNPERSGNGWVRLTGARVLDQSHKPTLHLIAGRPASFEFRYENLIGARQANVLMTIFNHLGIAITHFNMSLANYTIEKLGAGGTFLCHVPKLPLPIGQYRIAVAVHVDEQATDHIPNALMFEVDSSTFFKNGRTPPANYCACMVDHDWRHEIAEWQASIGSAQVNHVEPHPER